MPGGDAKKTAAKRQPAGFLAQAGKGRPKGVPNKATTAIKDMIVQALGNAGGVDYLTRQANENPVAFMGLVGKVIPLQHADDAPRTITVTWAE